MKNIFIIFTISFYINFLFAENNKNEKIITDKIEILLNNYLENITTGRIMSLYADKINYNNLGFISIFELVDLKEDHIEKWPYIKKDVEKINSKYFNENGEFVVNLNVVSYLYSLKEDKGLKREEELELIFNNNSLSILSEISKIKNEKNYTPILNNKLPPKYFIFNPAGGAGTSSSLHIDNIKNSIVLKSYGICNSNLLWKGTFEQFKKQNEFIIIEDIICRKSINQCGKLYEQKDSIE
ncbi:hypothetical protein GCM10012288_03450 [Malaciobacter pacificus]|uniref:Uncharacterized protein n=1 Tax=Malaciobacter pacificus TaxID=1080223 RepID=A0A5C2H8D8_9BACT|nr:hypothetical protein [Malaciobacter pacificus]QEP33725.1 hypothetical protein APAC_0576 [Malaciobacter pacificus]GGD32837.1 hypothetical protein GCM10012288_03450 [Malaciobacter pacificus]